jgi:3-hydroxyacyl-CoA dehydrogenase/enoyl-CoA hydratase/3-hydroxybutyryl-CoA epimerase
MPYLLEAVSMVEEGISIEAIDRAATRYGMPMGPITLADTVGLDICLHVGEIMEKTLDVHTPEILKSMVDRGALGRKTGLGFYEYKNGKLVKTQGALEGPDGRELADRLIGRLLNESVACLREGVVEDADLLDAGVIFGTGFAPFRGGPMHYAKETGIETLLEKFRLLKEKYGPRFAPDAGWDDQ